MLLISILNYHNAAATAHCLNALSRICHRLEFRIIVGDHSTESEIEKIQLSISPEIAEKTEFYHRPNNPGFGRGHNDNFGVAALHPKDIFLILNNDVYFPDPLILKDMLRFCGPETILGSVITRCTDKQIWFSGGHVNRFTGDTRPLKLKLIGEIVDTDFLCGCCMMMQSDTFEVLGGFDETFFMYAEDLDFSLRAVRMGFRLRVVNRELAHSIGGHSGGQYSDLFLRENTKNRLICLARHKPGVAGIREVHFFAVYFVGRVVQLLLFSKAPIRQLRAVISGLREGFRLRRAVPVPMHSHIGSRSTFVE